MTESLGVTGTLAQPSPAPVTDPDRPPDALIGPGIAGFVAIFLLAVAVVVLIRDMNRRVQRMRYRQAAREQADEGRGGDQDAGAGPDSGDERGARPGETT